MQSTLPMPPIVAFSLHVQWADMERAVEAVAEAGFDGIGWAVRPTAHIEPEEVATGLARAVKIAHAAGLATPEIITTISEASSPFANEILATMRELGIRHYRASAGRYDYDAPVAAQLDAQKRRFEGLAALNARYDTTAMFHTHSYFNGIGGMVWDMWMLMKDLDPRHIGINFDIGHVMAKAGAGWREAARIARPYVHALSTKDFIWERHADAAPGEWPWYTRFVRHGDGMVDYEGCFRYFQSTGFEGPIIPYFEYVVDVPGAVLPFNMNGGPYGKWTLAIPEKTFRAFMKRDVALHRQALRNVGYAQENQAKPDRGDA